MSRKETLNHVQPRCRSWCEVQVKPRLLGQPFPNIGVLVRGVVVTDQMQLLVLWCLTVDLAQEAQPLSMSMTGFAARDHCAIEGAQGSEQRGGAVALIVMRHGRCPAPFSLAIPVACDPVPESGFSRHNTTPMHVPVGSGTSPRYLPASQ